MKKQKAKKRCWYSLVLRSQHDQLLESKEPIQQRHKPLRKPTRKPDASKTLQRFYHECSFAEAGKSKSFQGGYPSEECCLCQLRLACHRRFFPHSTALQVYWLPHARIPSSLLPSSFSSAYSLLQLLRKVTSLVQFLVTGGSLEQLSQSQSHGPQIWSLPSKLPSLRHRIPLQNMFKFFVFSISSIKKIFRSYENKTSKKFNSIIKHKQVSKTEIKTLMYCVIVSSWLSSSHFLSPNAL